MKEFGNGVNTPKASSAGSEGGSLLENLKLLGTVVVGSIAITYLFSKYEDSIRNYLRKAIGIDDKSQNKYSNKRRRRSPGKRRNYRDDSFDMSSELSTKDRANKRNRSRDMFYITEEDTEEQESSICDDLVYPVCNDESTISYNYRRKSGKLYLNSNDELISAPDRDDEIQETYNHILTNNERILEKIYRNREYEASKFVEAIDKAVHQFKLDKVINYEKNQGIHRNKKDDQSSDAWNLYNDKPKNCKKEDNSPAMKATTLKDLYNADIQQISSGNKKLKSKNFDEKSVRLEIMEDRKGNQGDSKNSTASASESEFVVRKKKPKIIYPNTGDLKDKKDYIFFELLSVYTDNFLHDKQTNKKNKRSKTKLARK